MGRASISRQQSVRAVSGASRNSSSATSTATDVTALHYRIAEAIQLTPDQVQAVLWVRARPATAAHAATAQRADSDPPLVQQ